MDELVSIIMPSYNTGRYIAETINSVLQQTWKNWELLIVDDCSTDETVQIVESYNDSRIHLFVNEQNSGAAMSRNRALREAKGKWIAFLDSDDLWMPEKLECQIEFMKKNDCSFSYTSYCEIDEASQPLGKTVTGPKKITHSGEKCYCWQGCLTVMYDRDKIGTVQIADLKKHNDYAMWLQLSKEADCYLLKEVLAEYRRRKASISSVGYKELIRHFYVLWRRGEGLGVVGAVLHTGLNIGFGLIKKILYVR